MAADKKNNPAQSGHWMAAILESTDDAIIGEDLTGNITLCNEAACRFFGYSKNELLGRSSRLLIPEAQPGQESPLPANLDAQRPSKPLETVRQRKDGSQVSVSLMVSPVKDELGNVIGFTQIARDVTDRNLDREKLQASLEREKIARQNAESANRAKDNFLATLSHELRTPLNPVLLIASDAINDWELPPRIRTNFENIRKNIELEAQLIDDLLDLTNISSGQITLEPQMVNAQSILDEAVSALQKEMDAKEFEIVSKRNATDVMLLGDAIRLRQVFGNILKNAIKFTSPKGKITVETASDYGELTIKISDTGIGMTPEELEHAFSAFSQDRPSPNKQHRLGGLGLGLTISKTMVELHAGKMEASSAGRDQGSTISITLPLEKRIDKNLLPTAGSADIGLPPLKVETKGLRILLVEDHESTSTALSNLLLRRNYKILTADSVAKARELAAKEKFDFVISDIGLPDGDGNELMRELSALYGLKGIALTGFGMEEDIKRNLEAGFVAHLTKPVNIKSVEKVLTLAALVNR
jgi:PAS domain S-box-containing protein